MLLEVTLIEAGDKSIGIGGATEGLYFLFHRNINELDRLRLEIKNSTTIVI